MRRRVVDGIAIALALAPGAASAQPMPSHALVPHAIALASATAATPGLANMLPSTRSHGHHSGRSLFRRRHHSSNDTRVMLLLLLHLAAALVASGGVVAAGVLLASLRGRPAFALPADRDRIAGMLRWHRGVTTLALAVAWLCGGLLAFNGGMIHAWQFGKLALLLGLVALHVVAWRALTRASADAPVAPRRAWAWAPWLTLLAIVAVLWLAMAQPSWHVDDVAADSWDTETSDPPADHPTDAPSR